MPPHFPCTIWPSFSTANHTYAHTLPAPAPPRLINQVTSTCTALRSSVTEQQCHNREKVGGQGIINYVEATMSSSLRGEVCGELLHATCTAAGGPPPPQQASSSSSSPTAPHLHNVWPHVIQPLVHHTRERENGYE